MKVSRPHRSCRRGPVRSRVVTWDPWEHLGELRLEYGLVFANGAYLPEHQAVVLRRGMTRAEERSALAEEIAHHELMHWPTDDPIEAERIELRARRRAAWKLITVESLTEAIHASHSWFEVAEHLEVDPDLLELRVKDMTEDERSAIRTVVADREVNL